MKKISNRLIGVMLIILIVLLVIFSYSFYKVYYVPSSEEKPKIKIAIDKNIPPYSYYNEKGNLVGFHIDLLNAMEKYTPYSFVYVPMEWKDVENSLKTGYVDAIMGIVPTKERNKSFDFTNPYTNLNFVVFRNKNAPNIEDIGALANHKIVVVSEDITEIKLREYMNETGINFTLIEVPASAIAMKYVDIGYADYFIQEEKTGIFLISSQNLKNVIPTEAKLFSLPIAIAVRKGEWDLLSAFNDALKKLKDSGEYADIYQKWFLPSQKPAGFNYALIAIGIISALTAVLGVEYFRSWKREKKSEKRIINLMQFSRVLLEKMPVGIMYISDGNCQYMNPEGIKILGYSHKEINEAGIVETLIKGGEIRLKAKNGEEKWLFAKKIYYGDGIILSFMDITSLKLMEIRDRKRFEEINEMLDSLRNPVQNILFASEHMEREDMQKIIKENVEKIANILKKDID